MSSRPRAVVGAPARFCVNVALWPGDPASRLPRCFAHQVRICDEQSANRMLQRCPLFLFSFNDRIIVAESLVLADHGLTKSQTVKSPAFLRPNSIDFAHPDFPEVVWSAKAADHQIEEVADFFAAAGIRNPSCELVQFPSVVLQLILLAPGAFVG